MAVSSETVARLLGTERNALVRWFSAAVRAMRASAAARSAPSG